MKRPGEILDSTNGTKSLKPTPSLQPIVDGAELTPEAIIEFCQYQLPARLREIMLKFRETSLTQANINSLNHVIAHYRRIMINALNVDHISDEERETTKQCILEFNISQTFLESIKTVFSLTQEEISEENYQHKLFQISHLLNAHYKKELPFVLYVKFLAAPEEQENMTSDIHFYMHQLEMILVYLNEISKFINVCEAMKQKNLIRNTNYTLSLLQSLLENLPELTQNPSQIIIEAANAIHQHYHLFIQLDKLQDDCEKDSDRLENFEVPVANHETLQQIEANIRFYDVNIENLTQLFNDMTTIVEFLKSKNNDAQSSFFNTAFLCKVDGIKCILDQLLSNRDQIVEIEEHMMEDLQDLVAL